MARDIFGDVSADKKSYPGFNAAQIVTMVLGILSAAAGLFIIVKFKLVTALIAMGIAEMLTSAIPILAAIILIIYILLKLKWHTMRRWW